MKERQWIPRFLDSFKITLGASMTLRTPFNQSCRRVMFRRTQRPWEVHYTVDEKQRQCVLIEAHQVGQMMAGMVRRYLFSAFSGCFKTRTAGQQWIDWWKSRWSSRWSEEKAIGEGHMAILFFFFQKCLGVLRLRVARVVWKPLRNFWERMTCLIRRSTTRATGCWNQDGRGMQWTRKTMKKHMVVLKSSIFIMIFFMILHDL